METVLKTQIFSGLKIRKCGCLVALTISDCSPFFFSHIKSALSQSRWLGSPQCMFMCVGVTEWVMSLWGPLPSFLLHEPRIPLGKVQNTSTDYLLSVPDDPSTSVAHNHRHWQKFGYWQLIVPPTWEYHPRFHRQTNSDLVCLEASGIVVYTLSFKWPRLRYCYTVWLVVYLVGTTSACQIIWFVFYILGHNLLIQRDLQWQCGVDRQLKDEPQMGRNCWKNTVNLKRKRMWLVVSTKMYMVCCVTLASCSDPLLWTLMPFLWTTSTTNISVSAYINKF